MKIDRYALALTRWRSVHRHYKRYEFHLVAQL